MLCYHGVTANQVESFGKQIRQIASQAVAVDQIGCGKPGICLTFDDAFACLLDHVIPLVNRFDVPIAVFAVTENLDSTPHWDMPSEHPDKELRTMSKTELVALSKHKNVTIGSHSATHARLSDISSEILEQELDSSRDTLENLLGFAPLDLALPHGAANSQVFALAGQAGYRRVFTIEPKVNVELPADGRVGRFSVDPDMWAIEFRLTIAGAYNYLLPLRRAIGWLRLWCGQRPRRVALQSGTDPAIVKAPS